MRNIAGRFKSLIVARFNQQSVRFGHYRQPWHYRHTVKLAESPYFLYGDFAIYGIIASFLILAISPDMAKMPTLQYGDIAIYGGNAKSWSWRYRQSHVMFTIFVLAHSQVRGALREIYHLVLLILTVILRVERQKSYVAFSSKSILK